MFSMAVDDFFDKEYPLIKEDLKQIWFRMNEGSAYGVKKEDVPFYGQNL